MLLIMLPQLTGEYLLRQLVAPGTQETTVLVVILYRYASAIGIGIGSANSLASDHLPDPPPMQSSPAQANALHFLVVFCHGRCCGRGPWRHRQL